MYSEKQSIRILDRLSLNSQDKPGTHNPHNNEPHRSRDERTSREQLHTEVRALRIQDGATDRRADEQTDGRDGKHHTETGAQLADVLCHPGHDDRRQGDEAAGAETVQDGEDDDAGGIVDADPGEGEDGG